MLTGILLQLNNIIMELNSNENNSRSNEDDNAAARHHDEHTKLDDIKAGIEEVVDAVKHVPSHLQEDTEHRPKGGVTVGYDPSLSKEENEKRYGRQQEQHQGGNAEGDGGRIGKFITKKYPDGSVTMGDPKVLHSNQE